MKLNTRNFGEIEIDENKLVTFDETIPGFPNSRRYAFLFDEDKNSPFCWMQSVDQGEVAFALLNPVDVLPDYNPKVTAEELAILGEVDMSEISVYNILVVPPRIEDITVNLKAPIVINLNTKKAIQIILSDDRYKVRHNLQQEVRSQKEGE
jgi:flagellar assembly factor FliW